MILQSSNYEDIQRYYANSYVKLEGFGEKLFYIRDVTPEYVCFTDFENREGRIYLDDDYPYDLDFILPHKSLFQINKVAYLLVRIPARQYHRGITDRNCCLYRLQNTWKHAEISWEILNYYVTKTPYVTLSMAMKNNYISAALSPRISWAADGSLFCDRVRIGSIIKNTIIINPIFVMEIRQLLSDMRDSTDYEIVFTEKEVCLA